MKLGTGQYDPEPQKPRANKSLHLNEAPSLRSSASQVSLAFGNTMIAQFKTLCTEIDAKTRHNLHVKDCVPEYQRALDYIDAHPEDRDAIAALFADAVIGTDPPTRISIHLVRFCMERHRWPEVYQAARSVWEDGGNAMYGHEARKLMDLYDVTAEQGRGANALPRAAHD